MAKYLWKISQSKRTGYDIFDSAVVCARSEEEAKEIHPMLSYGSWVTVDWNSDTWANSPNDVEAHKIGTADESLQVGTVILASYNAG